MKKKLLSFIVAICMVLPCLFVFSACGQKPSDPAIVCTVTEAEWEINFNITKPKPQAQVVADNSTTLPEITSYTLRGEGAISETVNGLGLLKVAPNAMYMEFYVGDELAEDIAGTYTNTNPIYIGLTTMLGSYFPFSGKYNDFTYDETKKAYVAENLISTVINEEDITDTYDVYNRRVEVTFINGYLNTIYLEICNEEEFNDNYHAILFTFSNINSTTVDTSSGDVDLRTEL